MKKVTLIFEQDSGPFIQPVEFQENGAYGQLKEKYSAGTLYKFPRTNKWAKIYDSSIRTKTDFWPASQPQKSYVGKLTYLKLKAMVDAFDFDAMLNKLPNLGLWYVYWNDIVQKFECYYGGNCPYGKGIIKVGEFFKWSDTKKHLKPNIEGEKIFIMRYHTKEYPD